MAFSIKHSDRKSRMLNSFPGSFFNTTEEESGHHPFFLPTEMLEQRETSGAVRTGKLSLTCLWTRSDPSLFWGLFVCVFLAANWIHTHRSTTLTAEVTARRSVNNAKEESHTYHCHVSIILPAVFKVCLWPRNNHYSWKDEGRQEARGRPLAYSKAQFNFSQPLPSSIDKDYIEVYSEDRKRRCLWDWPHVPLGCDWPHDLVEEMFGVSVSVLYLLGEEIILHTW